MSSPLLSLQATIKPARLTWSRWHPQSPQPAPGAMSAQNPLQRASENIWNELFGSLLILGILRTVQLLQKTLLIACLRGTEEKGTCSRLIGWWVLMSASMAAKPTRWCSGLAVCTHYTCLYPASPTVHAQEAHSTQDDPAACRAMPAFVHSLASDRHSRNGGQQAQRARQMHAGCMPVHQASSLVGERRPQQEDQGQ